MNLFIFKSYLQARIAPRSERGANLVEYMLLLAFIAIIVLVAVRALGGSVSNKFNDANGSLNAG